MKSRKNLIIAVGAVAVIAVVVLLMMRPLGVSTNPATETMDPTLSGVSDAELAAPVDRSARWGFILYDDVKMTGDPSPSDATTGTIVTLNTGDQVYIGESDDKHKNQAKVTLFDGKSGWIDNINVFEATAFAPWNVLDSSTAPPKDWIPEELVPPAAVAQYRVVISSEFLMRASKNPNPVIADWAQSVLSTQAEGAAQ